MADEIILRAPRHWSKVTAYFRTADGLTGADYIDEPSLAIYRALSGQWITPDGADAATVPEVSRRYSLVRWDSRNREAWYREVLG